MGRRREGEGEFLVGGVEVKEVIWVLTVVVVVVVVVVGADWCGRSGGNGWVVLSLSLSGCRRSDDVSCVLWNP